MADESRDANVNLSATVSDYSGPMRQATADTNTLAQAVDSLVTKLDGLGRRTAKKIALFSAGDLAVVSGMTMEAAALQRQLSTLSASAAVAGRSMGIVTDGVRQSARDLGVSRDQIVALTTAISQMGVTSQRDLVGFSNLFLRTAAATGGAADGLASSMLSLGRQMGTLAGGTSQMTKFSDSLVSVSNYAGVSAQNVADFANSIAPFARAAGIGEKQVLGLSTAFVQAGNDGYAAANTFNTMLADITRQTQNGGPGLAKYASLVGMTVNQFKQLNGSDQVVSIFKAITEAGPKAVQILDSMGFDGIRAAKAIQTMAAQSGGLEKLVQVASGAYGNGSTNTGAQAAMGGLMDEMKRFGNITQDMATSIGSGLITPLTVSLGVLDNILAGASKLTGVFSAGGALAGVAGVAGAGISGIMGLASVAAIPASLRWLYNSKPLSAFRSGRQAGIANVNGEPLNVQDPYLNRYTGGEAGVLERTLFESGLGVGNQFGKREPGVSTWQRVAGAPIRAYTGYARMQADFYRESRVPGYARDQGEDVYKTMLAEIKKNETIGQSAWSAIKATATADLEAAKASLSAAKAAGGSGPVRGLLSKGFNLIGGPLGIATMAGIGALQVKGMADSRTADLADRGANTQFYNQIAPYNSALGQSTTNLVAMNNALTDAAHNADTVAQAMTNASRGYLGAQTTNANTASITTKDQAVAYLRSLNTTDPKVLQQAFTDLMRNPTLGLGGAQQAITAYTKNGGMHAGDITQLAGNIGGQSGGIMDRLKAGFLIQGTTGADQATQLAIGSIQSQYSDTYNRYGQQAAAQQEVGNLRRYITGVMNSGDSGAVSQENRYEALKQLEQMLGTDFHLSQGDFATPTKDFFGTDSGKGVMSYITQFANQNGVSANPDASAVKMLMKNGVNPTAFALQVRGYNAANPTLQYAMNNQGDANAQFAGAKTLAGMSRGNVSGQVAAARARLAKALGTSVNDPRVVNAVTEADFAGANLENVLGAVPDQNTPMFGALNSQAQTAQGLIGIQQQFQGTYQTRFGRFVSAQNQYNAAMNADSNAPNIGAYQQQATQNYEAAKASYGQFLQGLIQTQKNYQISYARSEQDFHLQVGYAEADFRRSRLRAEEDFGKQMQRSLQDTAKTIYNPMIRVQSQQTTDVGNLKMNLADQNSRIKQQIAQLRKLKSLGLSQQAIDELQLADPANAQQVDELVQEMSRLDAQTINREVSQRLSATKGLTQSDLSQTYRRTQTDFATSMARAQQDFATAEGRMAQAHALAISRAKQDLDNLTADYANTFPKMFQTAMKLAAQNLGGMRSTTIAELKAVQAQFPDLFGLAPANPRTQGRSEGGFQTAGPNQVQIAVNNLNVTAQNPTDITKALADKARQTRLQRATSH